MPQNVEETKEEPVEEEKFVGLDAYLEKHQEDYEAQFNIVFAEQDKSPADKLRVRGQ